MKLKKKITKVLAISMAFSMIFSSNAFATPIGLVNSTESVATDTLTKTEGTDHFADEDTNVWSNGEIIEEVRVSVQRGSEFIVTIPKDIVLDGETGKADYVVNAKGDISGDQVLKVVPDAEFELAEAGGKDSVTAIVTQDDTDYTYVEMQGDGTNYPGSVEATLTAGEWAGKFNFNINFKGEGNISLPEAGQPFEAYSWAEIAAISEVGEAVNYFAVGDEKKVQIGDEEYTLQIMGFNHDDLADGSGKAGMTLGLKEIMTTARPMNTTGHTNSGGWENSKMRTYLQNNILTNLPSDLQNVIKTINKKTSAGNMSTEIITSQDKLFLFSEIEIFGILTHSASGEGEQYTYYIDGRSKIKYYLSGSSYLWWSRSPSIENTENFYQVNAAGISRDVGAYNSRGVVFGLCI